MIIEDIIKTTETNIYPRERSYSKMPIWHDLNHIAVNDKALIYSDDVSRIILTELDV